VVNVYWINVILWGVIMIEYRELKKRKHVSPSMSIKRKTGCGNLYLHCSYDNDTFNLGRISVTLGKSGSCRASTCNGMGELISLLLQGNYDPLVIVERLENIACGTPYFIEKGHEDNNDSCCDAIANGLKEALDVMKELKEKKEESKK
jgi:hypothetical protein